MIAIANFGRRSHAVFGVAALVSLVGLASFRAVHSGAPTARAAAGQAADAAPLAGYAVTAPRAPADQPLLYDREYPAVPYSTGARKDPIAALAAKLERGEAQLTFAPGRGYLDSLLEALGIDPSSQLLVFSQTSLQSRLISPSTPRAIYFNDDVYVAWVQGAPLEIASFDPELGPVFYTLEQADDEAPRFGSELTRCLACHDSYSLTGGGVPRFIVGSGYIGTTGMLVSHEGWIVTTERTPFKNRFGGWYVTGTHGDQVHLGNLTIKSLDDFDRLDSLRIGNLDSLESLVSTRPYIAGTSDIVALLVFQHQTDVQNRLTRVHFDARTALAMAADGDLAPAAAEARIAPPVEELLRAMLFAGAVEYTAPIHGVPAFAEQFARRAVRDAQGRSLRDFDLTRRLFKYPLSFVIYSPAFDALPDEARRLFYARLIEVLNGADATEEFGHLTAADRTAIREILHATKPEFAERVAN